jgi:hypothetical protein
MAFGGQSRNAEPLDAAQLEIRRSWGKFLVRVNTFHAKQRCPSQRTCDQQSAETRANPRMPAKSLDRRGVAAASFRRARLSQLRS